MNTQGSLIAAAGGHMVDLWRMLKFEVKNPHSLSKLRQLTAVRNRTGATTLVETGTYLGNTARRASFFFENVYTVEVDQTLYEKAKTFLEPRKNVECLLGDCADVLPQLMARPEMDKVVLFLDGHFSGGETGCGIVEEPAVALLASLAPFRCRIVGIVIDDFRTLTGIDGTPTKSAVFEALEKYFPEFITNVHLDQILVEAA